MILSRFAFWVVAGYLTILVVAVVMAKHTTHHGSCPGAVQEE